MPISMCLRRFAFDRNKQQLAGFGLQGIARLKPGIPIAQANADVKRMLPIWEDSWPSGIPGFDSHFYEKVWKVAPAIRPLKQEVIGNVGNVLWVVMGTIGLVMLIACTNVANLLLVRADGRQQELAVRAALGAGRGRIAWELLLESVALGLIGGVIGIGIAYEGLRLLAAIGPANLPRLSEISLDARIARVHAGPFAALRTVIRIHSDSEICGAAHALGSSRRGKNCERQPGTATLPRFAGGGPGGDGPGTCW